MTSLRRYGVGSGQYIILLGALIFDHGMVNSEGKESILSFFVSPCYGMYATLCDDCVRLS